MQDRQVPRVSKNKSELKPLVIQEMLHATYWGKSRSVDDIVTTIENSICFGLYIGDKQIGFARVLTDLVVFAYLSDVMIHPDFKGKGYARVLLDYVFNDPQFSKIQRWNLVTRDAQELYKKYNFSGPKNPEVFMEKVIVGWADN